MDAMKKYRIPVDQSMIKLCDSREKAIAITPALLERPDHPDGFFAINDETASGILYSCKLTGRKVPDEVSICGFTDGASPKHRSEADHGGATWRRGGQKHHQATDRQTGRER